MHPELCKIGPFTIYSFGLFLMLAFLVAAGLVRRQAKKENINPDFIFNLSFLTFLVAIAGARFLYVLSNLKYYIDNPIEIIMLQHGGLSWFGGLIFGVVFAAVYLKKNHTAPKVYCLSYFGNSFRRTRFNKLINWLFTSTSFK